MAYGKISPKQQEILDFMKNEILNKGYPPSVREIKRLNHLATDDIHAGAALVIPYYSADMK